jgi:nicotinamidase-related amidase
MIRPVLLVVDMLNDFLAQWPAASRERLLQSTSELVALMRGLGHPII